MAKKLKDNYIYAYYQQIKNGSVTVGRWIELLYDRIIAQLEDGSLNFDQKKANDAIEWMEGHTFHTEGPLAPGYLKLELWQKAIVSCIFGLCDKNGKRQFREVLLIVARKNGKTLFAAAIAKYIWYVEGGFGTRVYCIAPKLEQADLVYNSIWQMTVLDPEWQQLKDEIDNSKDVRHVKTKSDEMLAKHRRDGLQIAGTNSVIKKIAFSAKKSDGFNPSLTICDEIASWQGEAGMKQYEVMKSGMGAREMGNSPSILLSCSTAGYVNDGIYDELVKRSTAFLLGNSKETKLLPFLYLIDDIEKWNDINELRKSNPNLGVSVSMDYLLEEIAIAEGSLSKKGEFICKYANIKQNATQAWFDSQTIEKAFGSQLKLEDFKGCYCVGGIDLSQTTDLTSCCAVIEKDGRLNVFSHFFLPAEKLEEATARDGVPYHIYVQKGWLTLSGDNFVDYHDCFNWFAELVRTYKIYPLQVGYDRYSAQYLVQDMEAAGFHMDDVYQGWNLTPVIREMEGLMKDGALFMGDNSLLKVHLLNTAIKNDNELNKARLIKINPNDHIDGCAALLDALTVRQKWFGQIGDQLANRGK